MYELRRASSMASAVEVLGGVEDNDAGVRAGCLGQLLLPLRLVLVDEAASLYPERGLARSRVVRHLEVVRAPPEAHARLTLARVVAEVMLLRLPGPGLKQPGDQVGCLEPGR
jgi:hypothetical protein